MPFNVLLLPLLGGYIFISSWNGTRFGATRHTGERLLIHAALAGLIFLTLSYCLSSLIAERFSGFVAWWGTAVPFEHSGVSLGALMLGGTLWWPLNGLPWFRRKRSIARALNDTNDYLEQLLAQALDGSRHVFFTLKSGKFYIGLITGSFDPSHERRYIRVLPTVSGYREPTTFRVVMTTDYTRVIDAVEAEGADSLGLAANHFEIIIPITEVASVTLFEWKAYKRFLPQP